MKKQSLDLLKKKVKENKSTQVSQSLLNANPYSAVLKAGSVDSPAEAQQKLAQARQFAADKAKEKQKAEAEKAQKTKESKAARQAAAQPKAPVESAKERKEREESERKQVQQAKEKKEQTKKETTQKVAPVNQKSLKKAVATQQKKKAVAFWEDESFQPIFLLVGFLFVLAGLGYAFSL